MMGWDSPAGSQTVHRTVCAGFAVALFESLALNTNATIKKIARRRPF